MSDNVIELVPGKTDKDMAEDYKRRIIEAYQPLLKLMTELDGQGFGANAQIGKTGMGDMQLLSLSIYKIYN